MKQAMIATWKMSYEGMKKAKQKMDDGCLVKDAIVCAIQDVESNEAFISVGHGGLPNRDGQVQLDSAYMDGTTFGFGGIVEAEHIQSPIAVSASLSEQQVNCLLSGEGAQQYAAANGFAFENHTTKASQQRWQQKRFEDMELKAYEGHDTVCVIGKVDDAMAVGVSTSGLFMKHPGRVGDSCIIGSGFYCDAKVGACAATGLGEDIMRGCLSVRVVDAMQAGASLQEALDQTLDNHLARMKKANRKIDAISLIGMDAQGHCSATTNIAEFPFVVNDEHGTTILVATYQDGKHDVFQADQAWLSAYTGD